MILSDFIYGAYSVKALPNACCWWRPSKERKRREGIGESMVGAGLWSTANVAAHAG